MFQALDAIAHQMALTKARMEAMDDKNKPMYVPSIRCKIANCSLPAMGDSDRCVGHAGAQVTTTTSARGAGLKFDGDKPRWTLMMQGLAFALSQVVAVLTFGAAKYQAHSWRKVENGQERYRDALYRHLAAYETGELVDPESGLPHMAHVATNAMFLMELDRNAAV